MHRRLLVGVLISGLMAAAGHAQERGNWPSFRGPQASGVAPARELPQEWSAEGRNVRWVAEIAGYSHSSPIVWGDRVFVVTSVSERPAGDGRRDGVGNVAIEDDSTREWRLLGLERGSGEVVWQRVVHRGVPRVRRHEKSSHANPTPATDGRYLVAVLNSEGLFCFDLDGRQLWRSDLGRLDPGYWGYPDRPWGHASSPVIAGDLVIVQADRVEDSFLAAFRLADGQQAWRVARQELATWSTPTLIEHGGRLELVTQGGNFARSYDPRSGRELWRFADHAEVKVPTPIYAEGKVLLTGGAPRGRPIFALDPREGSSSPEVLWQVRSGGPYTSTPLAYGPLLYVTRDSGILSVYRLADGELVYRERVSGGFSASAVTGGDKLYLASEDGAVYVVRPGESYELLASNDMGEPIFATPAISDDLLVIRTRSRLYGIGRAQ